MAEAMPIDPVLTFLVGAERSGTTLCRLMLDCHPLIAFQHEFELAVELVGDDGSWPKIEEFWDFLSRYRVANKEYEVDRSLDYPSLIRSFLEQKRRSSGNKPKLGATVHHHFDRVLHIWPDAKFIHMYRDGRDVGRSAIGMGWAGNLWNGVDRWIEAENLWKEKMLRLVPPERRIDLRYEDLVTHPERELRRISDFIGVPYDGAMLDYPNSARGKTYEKVDPKLAQQWKKKLSQREVQLAEAKIADMLIERGYELSGYPRLQLSEPEKLWLRAQNRYAQTAFRAKALGFRLWAEAAVARRVGSKKWRDDVEERVNDHINEYVIR
jgi:hypothetical protein